MLEINSLYRLRNGALARVDRRVDLDTRNWPAPRDYRGKYLFVGYIVEHCDGSPGNPCLPIVWQQEGDYGAGEHPLDVIAPGEQSTPQLPA